MPVWKEDAVESAPSIGEQLSQQQRMEMIWLLEEFGKVLCDDPGKRNFIKHKLISGPTQSI